MTRHLLRLSDLGPEGLVAMLDDADRHQALRGSRRRRARSSEYRSRSCSRRPRRATRLSLEVAVTELGGHPMVLTSAGSQMARGEPIADTARVLTRMVHAIAFRTFSDARLAELVEYSTVPVLNTLTDGGTPDAAPRGSANGAAHPRQASRVSSTLGSATATTWQTRGSKPRGSSRSISCSRVRRDSTRIPCVLDEAIARGGARPRRPRRERSRPRGACRRARTSSRAWARERSRGAPRGVPRLFGDAASFSRERLRK